MQLKSICFFHNYDNVVEIEILKSSFDEIYVETFSENTYFHIIITPSKGSNAQHLVEYEKQLLYEENQKSGNVMQQPIFLCLWYKSGWVVTWFLLGYTVRMFEYTVWTFRSNVGRFLYVFSSIPRKLYTISQPTFSPIKRYQDSIFKLLTLSTNSVTNVVRTAYFQIQARSSPLKNL